MSHYLNIQALVNADQLARIQDIRDQIDRDAAPTSESPADPDRSTTLLVLVPGGQADSDVVSPVQLLVAHVRKLLGLTPDGRELAVQIARVNGSDVKQPDDVWSGWVRAQAMGHPTPRALLGQPAHNRILVVVLVLDWQNTEQVHAPVEGRDAGPHPYFVAVGPSGETPGAPAYAVAKALCKVLGLGDEGTDPVQLSPPDFWGRSFPNLWSTTADIPTNCPWSWRAPSVSTPFVVGGFGQSEGVYRPTDSCLMGKPLGTPGELCFVCRQHVVEAVGGPVQSLPVVPRFTATGDVLTDIGVPPYVGGPERTLFTRIAGIEGAQDAQTTEYGLRWSGRDDAGKETWSAELTLTPWASPAGLGLATTLRIRGDLSDSSPPTFAFDLPAGQPSEIREATSVLNGFRARLRSRAPMPLDDLEEFVLRGAGWGTRMRQTEPAGGPVVGWKTTTNAPITHALHRPNGASVSRLWPTAAQGRGANHLMRLLLLARAGRTQGDRSDADITEMLSYIQCLGARETPVGPHSQPELFDVATTTTGFQITLPLPDPEDASEALKDLGAVDVALTVVSGLGGASGVTIRLARWLFGEPFLPDSTPAMDEPAGSGTETPPSSMDIHSRVEQAWTDLSGPAAPRPRQMDATMDATILGWFHPDRYSTGSTTALSMSFPGCSGPQRTFIRILRMWAYADRMGDLLTAYKAVHNASLQDDLLHLASIPILGIHQLNGQVRGLLAEYTTLRFAVESRRRLMQDAPWVGAQDLRSIAKAVHTPTTAMLQAVQDDPEEAAETFVQLIRGTGRNDEFYGLIHGFIQAVYAAASDAAWPGLRTSLIAFVKVVLVPFFETRMYAIESYWHIAPLTLILVELPPPLRTDLMSWLLVQNKLNPAHLGAVASLQETSDDDRFDTIEAEATAIANALEHGWHDAVAFEYQSLARIGGEMVRRAELNRNWAIQNVPGLESHDAYQLELHFDVLQRALQSAEVRTAVRQHLPSAAVLDPPPRPGENPYVHPAFLNAKARLASGNSTAAFQWLTGQKPWLLDALANDVDRTGVPTTLSGENHPDFVADTLRAVATQQRENAKGEAADEDALRAANAEIVAYQAARWALLPDHSDAQASRVFLSLVEADSAQLQAIVANANVDHARQAVADQTLHSLEDMTLRRALRDSLAPAADFSDLLYSGMYEGTRFVHPQTYLCWMRAQLKQAFDSGTSDPHKLMRLGYLRTRDTPSFLPAYDAQADAADGLFATILGPAHQAEAAWIGHLSAADAQAVKHTAFGIPGHDPALDDLDTAFLAVRIEDLWDSRIGYVNWDRFYVDFYANAGAQFNEALERLRTVVYAPHLVGDAPTRLELYKVLYADVLDAQTALTSSRSEAANAAAGAASTIVMVGLSIGVSVATGGAASPLAMAAITAASAGASLGTRYVIEGPRFITTQAVQETIQQAVIEGAVDLATGQVLRGARYATSMGGLAGKAIAASDDAAEVIALRTLVRQEASDVATTTAKEVVQGIVEGAMAGLAGEVGMTALDATAWDQSWSRTYAQLKLAGLRGLWMGGAFGIIGGLGGGFFGTILERVGNSPRKAWTGLSLLDVHGQRHLVDALDMDVLTTALLAGDQARVRSYLSSLDIPEDAHDLLVDAARRVMHATSITGPDLDWGEFGILSKVELKVISDAEFDALRPGFAEQKAHVQWTGGTDRPLQIVVRASDGAEALYEELIHAHRILTAKTSRVIDTPELDGLRTVLNAQENWSTLTPDEKRLAHAARAEEEAVVRQASVQHIDDAYEARTLNGTEEGALLSGAEEEALLRGIVGQQEAERKLEFLEEADAQTVSEQWLIDNGYADAPDFFATRTRTPEDIQYRKQLINAPKTGGRRRLQPDPRKPYHTYELNPDGPGGRLLFVENHPERHEAWLISPSGVPYDAELTPMFREVRGPRQLTGPYPDGEPDVAVFTSSKLKELLDESPIGEPISISQLEVGSGSNVIEVKLLTDGPEPRFTADRDENMRIADKEMQRRLTAIHPKLKWKRPKGYTWHEELDAACKATMFLVLTIIHKAAPHTGGVAMAKSGACP